MFAEMPLDNRTVVKFAAVAASLAGFVRPLADVTDRAETI